MKLAKETVAELMTAFRD